jgi:hypothetical protein
MAFPVLTPELARETLGALGANVDASALRVEKRDERWLVRLPGSRAAWSAASPTGRELLLRERRVLRLLEGRCSFGAPRVLREDPSGGVDVRALVPGMEEPWRLLGATSRDTSLAKRIGASVGGMLSEQHTRIRAEDAAGWLPRRPDWPGRRDWVRDRLRRVVVDASLRADAEEIIARYESLPVSESDRVLVHGDVGLHNLAIHEASHAVHGLYDYEGSAWADRHLDFRYLMYDLDRFDLLEAAIDAYEPATGRHLHRGRILLYNAACAVGFLAYRAGTRPDKVSCGRTLAEDLRWSNHVVPRALAPGQADLG